MSIHGFLDQNGQVQKYDYNDLENKPNIPSVVIIDDTLTEQGQAADAKAVGDAIANISISVDDALSENSINPVQNRVITEAFRNLDSGLSEEVKQAILQIAQKVAYIDANGQTYYQALYNALYATTKTLVSISAVFTQGSTIIYTTASLNDLKPMLVVTAHYDDNSSAVVTDYTLSGNLTEGASTIAVSYSGKTATFTVNVTAVAGTYTVANNLTGCTTSNAATTIVENAAYSAVITVSAGYSMTGATISVMMGGNDVTNTAYTNGTISIANVTGNLVITVTAVAKTLSSITATFNQGSAVIYTTASLNDLRQYLVVTAYYSDSTSGAVTDYTLSGTLTVGTSTITASYGGKTATFNVMVSEYSTAPVIAQSGKVLNKDYGTTSKAGFGITQWYGYEFTQAALEACQYWDSTNGYMSTNGWAGVKICQPDYLTYQAGYSWPSSANYKNGLATDGTYGNMFTITRNDEFGCLFVRQSTSVLTRNGFAASLPLSDIDYCYAYWYKPVTGSILPSGVTNGDIIFAGQYTPYYGLSNISEAPTLSSISATFNQGSTVVTTSTSLNSLKTMLSIAAAYSNSSTLPVNLGLVSLSGTLTEGTSTITATYKGKTATFSVTVSSGE